jgi:hypothetical protein
MTNILLGVLDLIMAAIAYLLYTAVFVPHLAKSSAYAKLKAREKAELDRRLEVEHYFGAKEITDMEIKIPVKPAKREVDL